MTDVTHDAAWPRPKMKAWMPRLMAEVSRRLTQSSRKSQGEGLALRATSRVRRAPCAGSWNVSNRLSAVVLSLGVTLSA